MVLNNLSDFNNLQFSVYFDDCYYFYDLLSGNMLWYDSNTDSFNAIIEGYRYWEKLKNQSNFTIDNMLYMDLMYRIENINPKISHINIGGRYYMVDKDSIEYLQERYVDIANINTKISLKDLLINMCLFRAYNYELDIFYQIVNKRALEPSEMDCFDYINGKTNRDEIDKIINKIKILGKENLREIEKAFLNNLEKI